MKKLLVFLCLTLLFLMVSSQRLSYVSSMMKDNDVTDQADVDDQYDISAFRNDTYFRKLKTWLAAYDYSSLAEQTILSTSFQAQNPDIDFENDETYQGLIAKLDSLDVLTVRVNVPTT